MADGRVDLRFTVDWSSCSSSASSAGFLGGQVPHAARQIGVLAAAQAAQPLAARRVDADQGTAPVGGVAGSVDEARLRQQPQGPGRRRALDALDLGELTGGQRAVALDRRQRRGGGRRELGPPAPAAASWRSLLAVRTIAIRNRAAASVSLFSCVVVVI